MKKEIKRSHLANGQLSSEVPYVNGKVHGLVRGWHPNGQLWYETPFVNGKIHGLAKSWYSNGQLRCEDSYKNNLQCGARIVF